jgi:hypothetical protein
MYPMIGNPGPGSRGDGLPPVGGWSKWVVGVVVPVLLGGYGVACIVTRSGTIWDESIWGQTINSMTVSGRSAVALGIAWVGMGMFLNGHFFWGNIYSEFRAAALEKIAGLMAFGGGLGYVIMRVFIGV